MIADYETFSDFCYSLRELYPFDHYILREPYVLNEPFNDVLFTEIFYCPEANKTGYDFDDYSIILKKEGVEIKLPFSTFEEDTMDELMCAVKEDWFMEVNGFEIHVFDELDGPYSEEESEDDLTEMFAIQKQKILDKYGTCKIKELRYSANAKFVK